MKLSKLPSALRREPLTRLAQEAAWRTLRSTRKVRLRIARGEGVHPLRFSALGYYQLQRDLVSAHARRNILLYAECIVSGRYPLLGYGTPDLGQRPDWQCDWVSGVTWPLTTSGKLAVVRHDGSDVKAPWELSRLQWCPVVAKAWALTSDIRYRTTLQTVLTDWIVKNPMGRGVNWTIAMEAALRGVSLCLTMELLWPFTEAEQAWRDLLEKSLAQHLRFIEAHCEFSYLVRSNHYLSNLVGLTTLCASMRGRGMKRKRDRYARAVQQEVLLQTYPDGGDREASTGYHVLVAQMALHSLVVQQRAGCTPAPAFEARLRSMFEWIATLTDENWTLPILGDCDNGRVELTQDDVAQAEIEPSSRHAVKVSNMLGLAAHILQQPLRGDAQDAVWLGNRCTLSTSTSSSSPPGVTILPDSGLAVLRSRDASVVFCAMPNGLSGKGSHTHCDKLSFVLRLNSSLSHPEPHEVFCDAGSRCYTRSVELRNQDRSTRAHNTLSIEQVDQNTISRRPEHLFQIGNEATVSPITRVQGEPASVQASHAGYERFGLEHKRTIQLDENSMSLIDRVSSPAESKSHLDLHFTLGPAWLVSPGITMGDVVSCCIAGPRTLTFECASTSCLSLTTSPTRISREYGASLPGTSLTIHTHTSLPATLRTTMRWN